MIGWLSFSERLSPTHDRPTHSVRLYKPCHLGLSTAFPAIIGGRSGLPAVEYSHHFERVLTGKYSVACAIFPSSPSRRMRSSAGKCLGKIRRHPYSDLPDDSWKRHVSTIQLSAKLSIRVTKPMPPRGKRNDRNLKRQPLANRQVFNTFNNPVESNREIPWPAGAVETRRCAKPARRDRVLQRQ